MNKQYNYDYSSLRARIKKKYGSIYKFSEAMGCQSSTMSMRLGNKVEWQQDDIYKASKLLKIPERDIGTFFYNVNVQGN